MTSMPAGDVEGALAGIRDALRLDGYELEITGVADMLSLRIVATEDACEDCLVPQAVMARTFSAALAGRYPPERIAIDYP
jgi:hypothetical protein